MGGGAQVAGHVGMRTLTPTARKGGGSLAIKKKRKEVAVVDQKEGGQGGGPPTRSIPPAGLSAALRRPVQWLGPHRPVVYSS